MKRFSDAWAVGLLGVVLMGGSARAASAGQQATASVAVTFDDGAVQSRIAANLKKSPLLAPRDIDVDVKKGIVTLTGKVRTASEKTRAGRLAKVGGVTRVHNRLEIDPKLDQSRIDAAGEKTKTGITKAVDVTASAAEKTKDGLLKVIGKAEEGVGKAAEKTSDTAGHVGATLSDTSVTTRVNAGFVSEALLRGTTIDVDTTDHIVTLKGTVPSMEAKTRAAAIAVDTEGVTRVVNELVVKGTE
jgi:osmotically-inducible protein OsmY